MEQKLSFEELEKKVGELEKKVRKSGKSETEKQCLYGCRKYTETAPMEEVETGR